MKKISVKNYKKYSSYDKQYDKIRVLDSKLKPNVDMIIQLYGEEESKYNKFVKENKRWIMLRLDMGLQKVIYI